jgi:sugar lactone lactonase YvrE
LLADGLHVPNGIVFQKYKSADTLLVAETSRFRVTRIYIDGEKRGNKEVAVEKLDIYPDNLKLSEKGELFIGAMGIKQPNFLWFS